MMVGTFNHFVRLAFTRVSKQLRDNLAFSYTNMAWVELIMLMSGDAIQGAICGDFGAMFYAEDLMLLKCYRFQEVTLVHVCLLPQTEFVLTLLSFFYS